VTAGALAADARDLALRIAAPRAASAPGTDVIFVLVDTLRADFLGCYGAAPSPSPAIDALAARSVFFERAFAQASWTFPSVAALMTSRHPSRLGLLEPPDPTRGNGLPVVPDGPPRLAELLRARGFHTAAFYKNPFLEPGSGFERGFEVYEHVGGDGADGHSGGQLVSEALRWARALADARARGDQAPFFLYLHFMEPHIDYQPPAEFVPEEARAYRGPQDGSARKLHRARRGSGFTPADVAYLRAMYRGDVAYLDTQIARLREELTRLGLWRDDTLFVFTADHGEQFGEHGDWEHGDMHVENVHVPLFLHGPRLAARRVPDVVRLVDVTPTLLALEGLPPLADAEGRSLSPLLRGDALPTLPAVSELGWRWRVTDDPFSLVIEGDQHELYDLRADPGEKQDLAASDPATVARLRAFLDAHEAAGRSAAGGSGAAVGRPLDDRMREQLKALGYLGE
jgi:arylsulfatase A-like enzyme